MKVILITNGFQFDYEINLSNALVKNVETLELIGGENYEIDKLDPRIRFINLGRRYDNKATFIKKLIRIFQYYIKLLIFVGKSKTKLIHVIWLRFSFIEGVLITLIFRIMGKKCIYTVHDVLPHDRSTFVNKIIYKIIYSLQNKLVVHTNFIKTRLVKEFNQNENNIYLFKHGVYNIVSTKSISSENSRNELGIRESDFIILFYGAIAQYKGLDLLLDTFKLITENHNKHIKLIIAGRVHPNYKKQFSELIARTDTKDIIILQGYQNDLMTEKLFKMANTTVLPYYEASQSGVLFLSYAYGVPVIAPSIGGFPDDIKPGVTGWLFSMGDKYSLQNAILKLMNGNSSNSKLQKDLIKKFARENYSWDIECKSLVKYCYTKN